MTTTLADYFQDVADAMCDGSVEALRMLLGSSTGRRYLTRDEPLLFALTYMPHSLKMPAPAEELAEGAASEIGVTSMSEFHWDLWPGRRTDCRSGQCRLAQAPAT